MPLLLLADRAVLSVEGPDARAFLDRLLTSDVDPVTVGRAGYAALLTPQGKILADLLLFQAPPVRDGDAILLDVPAAAAADLTKRLGLYKLRAKVTVSDRSGELSALAGWGESTPPTGAVAVAPDPRLPALGWRALVPPASVPDDAATRAAYDDHRVGLGVPEGGRDFAFGDAFPHEAMMDQLAGVDFRKGCYVGQEVVSRTQHRGTARTRILPLAFEADPPPPGTPLLAGERTIGMIGTSSGTTALATLRLDRLADAYAAGETLSAAGSPALVRPPNWIGFAVPTGPDRDAA